MPDPISALVVGGTTALSSALQSKAAKKAGQAQVAAAEAGSEEQRLAREEMRRLLQPYTDVGVPALQQQMAALGLSGPESQQQYVSSQEQSPIFQALARQGEESILQQASATGGLRGGNVQGALAQFRPGLLNQFLTQRFQQLGGLTELGQQSAAGVGTAGMGTANALADLAGQAGAARAGSALGKAQAWGNALALPAQFAGLQFGRTGQGFESVF
jgi:hypothetical protein